MTELGNSQTTALFDLHLANGAKMVPFAGYQMPVNYPSGIIKEHLHTRNHASLFDVSHMGQIRISGENIGEKLESLIPVDLVGLKSWRQKYGLFLNQQGGILDDLMVMNCDSHFTLVVNAACKAQDFQHLNDHLGAQLDLSLLEDRALIAIQGPDAVNVLRDAGANVSQMKFMDIADIEIHGVVCTATRSGYTGEDGFEISIVADDSPAVVDKLLQHDSLELAGLGARDSLRMEAGLCLYGQDISKHTTPVEAGLLWALSPSRRIGGARAGGFPGADVVLDQIENDAARKLVGLAPEGKAPMRAGTPLFDQDLNNIGSITSGGFSPSLSRPISMGYVSLEHAKTDAKLLAEVRGKYLPVTVSKLPFVPNQYAK
jgi:aminomethyltransferase